MAGPLPAVDLRPLLAVDPVEGCPDERRRARADPVAVDGLGGPMDGFFFFFYLINRGGWPTTAKI